MIIRRICGLAAWSVLAASFAISETAPAPALRLAEELAEAGNHAAAALEYRREAMSAPSPVVKGSLYWMASYEYSLAGRFEQADRMAGEVEDTTAELDAEVYLLRAHTSRLRRRPREAVFYLESLTQPDQPDPVRQVASRQLAVTRLQLEDYKGARSALREINITGGEALDAIANYESGKDKSPVVGGLLGLVPGLGYAHSGEYGNALRSLIMNGLCIWGIVEFAEREQWGGVAVTGFAGITFYSGSIYGGADAAVRYNRRRFAANARVIEEHTRFVPDRATLPILTLKYQF